MYEDMWGRILKTKVFDDDLEKASYEAPNCIDSEVIECFGTNYVDERKCYKVFGDVTKYEIGGSDQLTNL